MPKPSLESRLTAISSPAIVPGLERTRALLRRLGNPQRGLRIIHVAGSNGKGSVCRMLESVLLEHGQRVGLFISPHLVDFNERFRVDGRMASHAALMRAAKPLWGALREQAGAKEGAATYFEALTALAFLYFKQQKVATLVLETGLGGRLDSTNVIEHPWATVVTSISLEHTQILGKTIAKIAFEKAGIAKRGAPMISSAKGAALGVLRREWSKRNPGDKRGFVALDRGAWSVHHAELDLAAGRQKVDLSVLGVHRQLSLPLLGQHQRENLACALATLQVLAGRGLKLDENAVRWGVTHATWPARLQVIGDKPLTFLDGAHNPDGAKRLAQSLRAEFKRWHGKRALVLGVLKDKDWPAILRCLAPLGQRIFVATPPDARGLDAGAAQAWLQKRRHRAVTCRSLAQALRAAQRWAGPTGLVLAAGSLYSAGAILKSIAGKRFLKAGRAKAR